MEQFYAASDSQIKKRDGERNKTESNTYPHSERLCPKGALGQSASQVS